MKDGLESPSVEGGRTLLYRGSVKDIFRTGTELLEFEFSNRFSVFDWGEMPDQIPDKGKNLARFAKTSFDKVQDPRRWQRLGKKMDAVFSSLKGPQDLQIVSFLRSTLGSLTEHGLRTHYLAAHNSRNSFMAREVQVLRPHRKETAFGSIYEYQDQMAPFDRPFLVPLEVVFRFGVPAGSSFRSRMGDGSYLAEVGLDQEFLKKTQDPRAIYFDLPVIEFFTKLEEQDRHLRLQEALLVSGLNTELFASLKAHSILLALFLREEFSEIDLKLWDGKFEWGADAQGIFLVDSIGPDELRLELKGESFGGQKNVPLSKEFLRLFYRKSSWFEKLETFKAKDNFGWKDEMKAKGILPPALPQDWIAYAKNIYEILADLWEFGKTSSAQNFSQTSKVAQLVDQGQKLLLKSEQSTEHQDWWEAVQNKLKFKTRNVAVLGSGGREDALAQALRHSAFVGEVFLFPGNGVSQGSIACDVDDLVALKGLLREFKIDLVVIGPDNLLEQGYANDLRDSGFLVFGPTREASRLEWQKSFAKDILVKRKVPTAQHWTWTSLKEAQAQWQDVLTEVSLPLVLKYDGLALGKGVEIIHSADQGMSFLKDVFENSKFSPGKKSGSAQLGLGARVVCEKFLEGREVSLFAVCDGKDFIVLEPACDAKRLREGNEGPNTGGMGAFSPVPWLNEDDLKAASQDIFEPVLDEMKKLGHAFSGLLYAGLMFHEGSRSFSVIEFNARFGDPETQALLPRLKSDFLTLLMGAATGDLLRANQVNPLTWDHQSSVTIVAASRGYPETSTKGVPINFDDNFWKVTDSGFPLAKSEQSIFLAGVKNEDTKLLTWGGRVLAITCLGNDLREARRRALDVMASVHFDGMQCRKDLGLWNAVNALGNVKGRFTQKLLKVPMNHRPKEVILFASGRGSNARALWQAARENPSHFPKILGVVCNRKEAPVLEWAREVGLRSLTIPSAKFLKREDHEAEILRRLSLDWDLGDNFTSRADLWCVLAGYMRLFSPSMIMAWSSRVKGVAFTRMMNIHPSLLPSFKGVSAYGQALEHGAKVIGATVHLVSEDMDSGPILAQDAFAVSGTESLQEVEERGLKLEHQLYAKTLRQFYEQEWSLTQNREGQVQVILS